MTGKMFRIALFFIAACMVMGCAAQKPTTIAPAQDLNPKLAGGEFVPKVGNFIVILDGTTSMADPYRGATKSAFAKGLASLMNQTIRNMNLTAGLRTFGDLSAWDYVRTARLYGMTQYTKTGLDKAINDVGTFGTSPLELAITGASEDLKGTSGNIAVIIFSDGEDMDNKPILAARGMKALYGDRVCIYTVQTGTSPVGKKLLADVAQEGGCGFFVTGDSIASSDGMADFVEKVFFMRKTAHARPAPLEEVKEAKVEKKAAAEVVPERVTLNVLFDTNKAAVKTKYFNEIKKVADFMEKYPTATAVIEGHTDSVGKVAANVKLSQRRADAIKNILVEKYKIEESRIKAVGFGPKNPIADNKTAAGRQKNRRVEAVFEIR
ncbi:MAG: OmpA family protein [Syntrophales bacterium]